MARANTSFLENMELDIRSRLASGNLPHKSEEIRTSNNEFGGFKVDLFAEYFQLKSPYSEIYHYRVKIKLTLNFSESINPERKFQSLAVHGEKRKEVIAKLLEFNKCDKFKYIYDGRKNILTSVKLPVLTQCTFTIKLRTCEMYDITLQPVKKYYGSNAISVSFLRNMNLRSENMERKDLLQLYKALEYKYNSEIRLDKYYSVLHVDKFDIGKGLEVWRGYEQRVNINEAGPAYVLTVSELIFHKSGPAIDYVSDLLGVDVTKMNRLFTSEEVKEIKNALRGIQMYSTNLQYRRKYVVEDVTNKPATNILLAFGPQEISVAKYYEEKYCRLLFPHFPCFQMISNNYPLYIPLELCIVLEGQLKIDHRNSGSQNNFNSSGNFVSTAQNNITDTPKQSLFMHQDQETCATGSTDPPVSKCLEGSQVFNDTRKCGIQKELSKSDAWIVLSFVDETRLPMEKIAEFVDCLKAVSHSLRLRFGRFLGIHIVDKNETVDNAFQKEEIKHATLAVILLSKKCFFNYHEVKFIADYKLGLVTKCVQDNTIYALNRRIAVSICLGIDRKMGGIYDLVKRPMIFSQPIVVFGAVIESLGNNTISSVVGSLDAYPSKYQVSCRVQEVEKIGELSRDFITDLENMAKTIINSFYHHTKGKYPEKIVFFRSSSILSHFQLLMYYEVKALQKMCKDIMGFIIPITFIVSRQQPNSVRSFRIRSDESDGAPCSDIFHYNLCSNVDDRPTYYYVLHNDNKFNGHELHQLTRHMCYAYKCKKYMSTPTPIRYAHRAAIHAKKYAYYQCSKYEVDIDNLPASAIDSINEMECKCPGTFKFWQEF